MSERSPHSLGGFTLLKYIANPSTVCASLHLAGGDHAFTREVAGAGTIGQCPKYGAAHTLEQHDVLLQARESLAVNDEAVFDAYPFRQDCTQSDSNQFLCLAAAICPPFGHGFVPRIVLGDPAPGLPHMVDGAVR